MEKPGRSGQLEPARLVRSWLFPPVDGSVVCGLCCGDAGAVSLHDEVALEGAADTLELRRVLAVIVGVEINSDALPETLCLACTEAALASYRFLQLCQSYSSTLSRLAGLVRSTLTAETRSSEPHGPGASALFLLLQGDKNEVLVDSLRKIDDSRSASKRLNILIKKTKVVDVQCKYCAKIFDSKRNLRKHLPRCSVLLYRSNPTGPGYTCAYIGCYKRCSSRSLLRLHIMRAHEDKKHPCSVCCKKFGSPILVEEHMRAKHVYRECRICQEGFNGRKSLWLHEKSHEILSSTERDGHSGKSGNPKKAKKKENKIICDICGQKFARIGPLRQHLFSKHDFPKQEDYKLPSNKLYKCHICDFASRRRNYVKIHISRMHLDGERKYSCELCGKCFHRGSDLSRHRITHTRERPEVCTLCDKRFVNKAALLYHTRLHTGERPYPCDVCGERFLSASRRGHHIQVKHCARLQCSFCPSSYTEKKSLKKHVQKQHSQEELTRGGKEIPAV